MKDDGALHWPERFARNVRAIELWADGATLRDIGDAIGVSHVAVISILDGAGVPRCGRGRRGVGSSLAKNLALLDARYRRALAKLLRSTSASTKETP